MDSSARIAVVGLGYVGLPLSVALARHYQVVGFDINPDRVRELGDGLDRTGEIERKTLLRADLSLTAISEEMSGFDIFIVTVPTPIDSSNEPNLGPLEAACKIIAPCLSKGAIVYLCDIDIKSLNKIKKLPKETKIFCGHEYTHKNAEFCMKYDLSLIHI